MRRKEGMNPLQSKVDPRGVGEYSPRIERQLDFSEFQHVGKRDVLEEDPANRFQVLPGRNRIVRGVRNQGHAVALLRNVPCGVPVTSAKLQDMPGFREIAQGTTEVVTEHQPVIAKGAVGVELFREQCDFLRLEAIDPGRPAWRTGMDQQEEEQDLHLFASANPKGELSGTA